MKKLSILFLGLAFLTFSACEKETTEGLATVTNYPLFTMEGDNPMFLELGTAYTEPGVIAKEGETEIDVETSWAGAYQGGSSFDANVADCYTVTYTATNKDGYDGNSTRRVYLAKTGDLVNSIEGLYTSTIVRNGALRFTDLGYVLIYKNADGSYGLSCSIGGYYEIGTGYGATFNAPGVIVANDISANDFTFSPTSVTYGGWPWAINTTDMVVDAANKTINLTSVWDIGYTFEVELTQVQL